ARDRCAGVAGAGLGQQVDRPRAADCDRHGQDPPELGAGQARSQFALPGGRGRDAARSGVTPMYSAQRVVVAHRHALIAIGLAETLRRQLLADIRVAAPPARRLDDVDILVVDPDSAPEWSASMPARGHVAMV